MTTFNVVETKGAGDELVAQFLCGDEKSDAIREMFGIQNDRFGTVAIAVPSADEDVDKTIVNVDVWAIKEIIQLTKHTYWMKSILKENGFEKAEG